MNNGIIIKSPEQIEGIRKSSLLAAKTLEFLVPIVKAGVTTNHLNNMADQYIRDNGAIPACQGYRGFPKAVCISINEVVCHGIPSDRVLKDGDIVNIDVTTILDGYFGDTSMMYAVGEVSDTAQKLMDITQKCLDVGIEQVKPGNRFGNIGYYINKLAVENRYSVVYNFVGHGTGLQFHEDPQVVHVAAKDSGDIMLPGMIFTIEPMINEGVPHVAINESDNWTVSTKDGKLSAQYEHTVLVTDTGYEILTKREQI